MLNLKSFIFKHGDLCVFLAKGTGVLVTFLAAGLTLAAILLGSVGYFLIAVVMMVLAGSLVDFVKGCARQNQTKSNY